MATGGVCQLRALFRTISPVFVQQRNLNANRSVIWAKTRRATYARTYPVTMVNTDGSTVEINYEVPRKLIRLPVDEANCSDEQRLLLAKMRRSKEKVQTVEEVSMDFDPTKYI